MSCLEVKSKNAIRWYGHRPHETCQFLGLSVSSVSVVSVSVVSVSSVSVSG